MRTIISAQRCLIAWNDAILRPNCLRCATYSTLRFRHCCAPPRLSAARYRRANASARAKPSTRRSEEHTSELQSLMRISYAVFCLKKKKNNTTITTTYLESIITTISDKTQETSHTRYIHKQRPKP